MPDDRTEARVQGLAANPEFARDVMPHVRYASEEALEYNNSLMYIGGVAGKRPDQAIWILDLFDGDMDRALREMDRAAPLFFPVIIEMMDEVISELDGPLSGWPRYVRRELISYLLMNRGCARGLDRLLDRHARGRCGSAVFDIVANYPALAGCDQDAIIDMMEVMAVGRDEPAHPLAYWDEGRALVTVFGRRWREWVDACDIGIPNVEMVGRIHIACNMAGLRHTWPRPRSTYRGLAEFLFQNLRRMRGYKLRLIVNRWDELRDLVGSGDVDAAIDTAVRRSFSLDQDDGLAEFHTDELLMASSCGLGFMDLNRMRMMRVATDVLLPIWAQLGPVRVGNYEGRFLARSDIRTPYLGGLAGCCQHLGGAAQLCAIHSAVSPRGAAFVIQRAGTDDIVAMSWAWSTLGVVVFDSIEGSATIGDDVRMQTAVRPIYQETARRMVASGLVRSVTVGVDRFGFDSSKMPDLPIWPHVRPALPDDYISLYEAWKDAMGRIARDRPYAPDSCIRKLVLAADEEIAIPTDPFVMTIHDPGDMTEVREELHRQRPNGRGGACGPSAIAALLGMNVWDIIRMWPEVVGHDFGWLTTTGDVMRILGALGLDASCERVHLDRIPDPPEDAAILACVILWPNVEVTGWFDSIHERGWHWIPTLGDICYPNYHWIPREFLPSGIVVKRLITVRKGSWEA